MSRQPWHRLDTESSKAHAAFLRYMRLPVESRSIDEAYRVSNEGRPGIGSRAAGRWREWSVTHNWLARSTAHDAHLAQLEQDRIDALWAERKQQARERDFTQADTLRNIVDEALPHAERFIRSQRTFIQGKNGAPDREIVTLSFDITGLTTVLEKASRLQRLSNDESTENVGLSGAALESAIKRELARVADIGQAATAETVATDAAADPAPQLV